jgi:hypothetical protein
MAGLDKLREPTVAGNSGGVMRMCTFGWFGWISAAALAYVSSDDESTLLVLVSPVE